MNRIVVIGATGNVGRPLVRQLLDAGIETVAASRAGHSVHGAVGIKFDYADVGAISEIADGADAVYAMMPTGYPESLEKLDVIASFARSREMRVVLHTALETYSGRGHHYAPLEDLLIGSRARYSIIRPSWYMQNFLHFWPQQMRDGLLELPAGEGRMSLVDVEDIAACARTVLLDDSYDGAVLQITGARAYSFGEALAVLSAAARRTITYRPIARETDIARAIEAGSSRDEAEFFGDAYEHVRAGYAGIITDDVERLTGRPPVSFEAYAAQNAHLFA